MASSVKNTDKLVFTVLVCQVQILEICFERERLYFINLLN